MKQRTDFWEMVENQYANMGKNKRGVASCDKGQIQQDEGRQECPAKGTQEHE